MSSKYSIFHLLRRPLVLLVDMDGVLVDFDGGFAKVWKCAYPHAPQLNLRRRKHARVEDEFTGEYRPKVRALFRCKGFYRNLLPVHGALGILDKLQKAGFEVWICTRPLKEHKYCVPEKYAWVEEHFGKKWTRRMIVTRDKTLVYGDFLIDDLPNVFGIRRPVWKQVLFETDFSRNMATPKLNWTNWRQVLRKLSKPLIESQRRPLENLEKDYRRRRQKAERAFATGKESIFRPISSEQEKSQRSLTLIMRLDPKVSRKIAKFVAHLSKVESGQYTYDEADLHVTFLSLMGRTSDIEYLMRSAAKFRRAIRAIIHRLSPFCIRFRGITASPNSVTIQGFPEPETLDDFRDLVRGHLNRVGLGKGLEKRFFIQSAHVSVFRLRKHLSNRSGFLRCLWDYQNHEFGETTVNEIHLVLNDSVMSHGQVRVLEKFTLS